MFEDSPTGADAGRTAGMRVVGVETTPTHFRDIDLRVEHFSDPKLEALAPDSKAGLSNWYNPV